MKLLLILVYLFTFFGISAQNLNAYLDYRNYFTIFDNGEIKQIEYLPVSEFKVGDRCIAYIDNNNHFKVYTEGQVHDLTKLISEYKLTDNYCTFKVGDQLFVFDNGEKKLLCINVVRYAVGDNIVVFFDEIDKMLKAYYDGKIIDMEDALSDAPLYNFEVGDNVAAYLDNRNHLKALINGKVEEIIYYSSRLRFGVGGDLLAYVDPADNTFYVYNKGEIIPLESFPPKSFKIGDDFVAYVDNTGTFKLYKDSYKETILSFEPDFYKVRDNLVLYSDQGYFYVYYNNRSYTLEDYIPADYQFDYNSVAYRDVNGNLKLFKEGKVTTVTYEKVSQFKLAGNTLYYEEGIGTDKVFY
ncbi:MAG: hypothetical protein JXB49_00370 [Bacteroidales bacterium]|nr:hypothetical protein [Bacteroidales bacterium]